MCVQLHVCTPYDHEGTHCLWCGGILRRGSKSDMNHIEPSPTLLREVHPPYLLNVKPDRVLLCSPCSWLCPWSLVLIPTLRHGMHRVHEHAYLQLLPLGVVTHDWAIGWPHWQRYTKVWDLASSLLTKDISCTGKQGGGGERLSLTLSLWLSLPPTPPENHSKTSVACATSGLTTDVRKSTV